MAGAMLKLYESAQLPEMDNPSLVTLWIVLFCYKSYFLYLAQI